MRSYVFSEQQVTCFSCGRHTTPSVKSLAKVLREICHSLLFTDLSWCQWSLVLLWHAFLIIQSRFPHSIMAFIWFLGASLRLSAVDSSRAIELLIKDRDWQAWPSSSSVSPEHQLSGRMLTTLYGHCSVRPLSPLRRFWGGCLPHIANFYARAMLSRPYANLRWQQDLDTIERGTQLINGGTKSPSPKREACSHQTFGLPLATGRKIPITHHSL